MDNKKLDELERVARALTYPDDWHTEGRNVCSPAGFVVAEAHGSASAPDELMIRATYIAAFDPPTILALITAARRPALPDREAVARVIDPEAFDEVHGDDNWEAAEIFAEAWDEALAKADAILAMLSAPPKEGD